ncbi:MAG: VCBS repeat-containing protein, partial [Nanoarchaeota archaeon]|nr:VCBS repeat-containing protein [Nanoarchaeota archaeon]
GILSYPYSYAPLTIGDVNNDGKKEIFSSWKQYSTGTSPASVDDGYCLHGWNYDGSLFPNFPLRCSDNYLGSPWSPIILSDINDDDFLELILGVIDQTESNFKIFVFNHQGQLMTGWPVEINFVENRNFYIPLAVEDLDNDGKKEILFSSNDRTLIFDYQGNLKKIFPIAMTAGMSIGDLTGDGKLDILKRYNSWLGLFNFEGVVPEWGTRFFYSYGSVLTPGYSISSGSLGDLNNDGVPEIVIGSSFFRDSGKPDPDYQDKIYIFEANGSILNYWNISDIDFYKEIGAQPVIADITNDGKQDIIANVLGLEGNQLYAWNSDGSIIRGFPKNLGAFSSSYNSPVIDDIDNDGNLEILVYVFKFIEDVNMPGNYIPLNKILVFDLDTIYNPKKMDWPMYMHDVKNTNCYKCDNVSIIPLRPQSKVVNNNDFEVTGNLIMKLQKKVNDKWMDEQIVTNTDVIIAPNNLIKLDIGEDYGWNLKNVNAKSYGDYRIYVSFEVDNQKQEAFWEFKVIASKKIEKISNFPKISSFK